MQASQEQVALLLQHGFTEATIRAYLTLLHHPPLPVAALAKASGVPRSHLYNVLADLHGKGLVDIVLSHGSRTYRARPYEDFLRQRTEELEQRVAQLRAQAHLFASTMRPPPAPRALDEAGEVRLVLGRRMVSREIDVLLQNAEEEIIIGASDDGLARVLVHIEAVWPTWDERAKPPLVTLVVPLGGRRETQALGSMRRAIEVRRCQIPRPVISVITDRSRLLLVHPIPPGGEVRVGRDLAIYSDDPAFVASQRGLILAASTPEG